MLERDKNRKMEKELIILVMTSQGASDNIDHAFNRALANSSTQTKEAPLWNNMTKLEKSGAKGGT
ncbi:hypothetical protein YC2023_018486 [Brassica napus]